MLKWMNHFLILNEIIFIRSQILIIIADQLFACFHWRWFIFGDELQVFVVEGLFAITLISDPLHQWFSVGFQSGLWVVHSMTSVLLPVRGNMLVGWKDSLNLNLIW